MIDHIYFGLAKDNYCGSRHRLCEVREGLKMPTLLWWVYTISKGHCPSMSSINKIILELTTLI